MATKVENTTQKRKPRTNTRKSSPAIVRETHSHNSSFPTFLGMVLFLGMVALSLFLGIGFYWMNQEEKSISQLLEHKQEKVVKKSTVAKPTRITKAKPQVFEEEASPILSPNIPSRTIKTRYRNAKTNEPIDNALLEAGATEVVIQTKVDTSSEVQDIVLEKSKEIESEEKALKPPVAAEANRTRVLTVASISMGKEESIEEEKLIIKKGIPFSLRVPNFARNSKVKVYERFLSFVLPDDSLNFKPDKSSFSEKICNCLHFAKPNQFLVQKRKLFKEAPSATLKQEMGKLLERALNSIISSIPPREILVEKTVPENNKVLPIEPFLEEKTLEIPSVPKVLEARKDKSPKIEKLNSSSKIPTQALPTLKSNEKQTLLPALSSSNLSEKRRAYSQSVSNGTRNLEVQTWLNQQQIEGIVSEGTNSRLLVNKRVLRLGDEINPQYALTWVDIDSKDHSLYFSDASGTYYRLGY